LFECRESGQVSVRACPRSPHASLVTGACEAGDKAQRSVPRHRGPSGRGEGWYGEGHEALTEIALRKAFGKCMKPEVFGRRITVVLSGEGAERSACLGREHLMPTRYRGHLTQPYLKHAERGKPDGVRGNPVSRP